MKTTTPTVNFERLLAELNEVAEKLNSCNHYFASEIDTTSFMYIGSKPDLHEATVGIINAVDEAICRTSDLTKLLEGYRKT